MLKPDARQLARQICYLSKFMKFNFSELISIESMNTCLGFLFSQPKTYIRIVLRAVTADATQCKSSSQAYCESETYALVHLSLEGTIVFVLGIVPLNPIV